MADDSLHDSAELAEMANEISFSPRNGKGRGRGGKNGGGSGRRGQGRDVDISKALSKLLRHAAQDEGLRLDPEGFARVDEVLKWQRLRSLQTTFSDIQTTVRDNAKQRFSMKPSPEITPIPDSNDIDPSHWLIRANQGHSIPIESSALLKPITLEARNLPEVVVHGTYFVSYPAILKSGGLKRMGRNHVHFSTGLPEDKAGVISGMRRDSELLIHIDIEKSLEDGAMSWWLSDNVVVLTEGDENGLVPTKYWKSVEGRAQNVGLLWVDGVEIAGLPRNIKGRKLPIGRRQRENPKGKDTQKDGRNPTEELSSLGGEDSSGMEEKM